MELLISIEYFENNTVIDTDLDSNKVSNHILEAHEIQLNELLGDDLYNRIQTALETPGSDTDAEALADECKQFVLKATELNLVPFLNTPVTAKGTQERSGNFTASAGGTDKGLVLDNIRAKVQKYGLKVVRYLEDNIDKYPEYNSCNTTRPTFYTGIFGV